VLASMTEEEKKLVTRVIRRWKEQRALRLERDAQRKLNAERNSHEMPTEEPKGWWERRKLNFKRNSKKTVSTQPEGKKSWIGWNSDKTSSEEISVIKGVPNGQRTGDGHSFLKKSLWGQLLQDMPTQVGVTIVDSSKTFKSQNVFSSRNICRQRKLANIQC